jgi:hypothetical protein
MSNTWRHGETFFSPMGSGVGSVVSPKGGPSPLSSPALVSSAAGTPRKLAAQELYWSWFQIADEGAWLQLFGPDVCHRRCSVERATFRSAVSRLQAA